MCCFSGKRTEVHGISIFARRSGPTSQVLVYQMRYRAAEPTAMILPLPVALPGRESSVVWKNLKEHSSFFGDLDLAFPMLHTARASGGAKAARAKVATELLPVHDVGDFVASFVPRVDDFARMDPRFSISPELWKRIPAYADYGFAVFQLKELTGAPHPIAFEFQSRMNGKLFLPTVHIHDGTVHERAEFDHVLYVQDARFDLQTSGSEYHGPDHVDDKTGFVRSKDKAGPSTSRGILDDVPRPAGIVDANLLLHRKTVKGLFANVDTVVDLDADVLGGCGRCDVGRPGKTLSLGPALALAGLGWVLRRRIERRRPA